MCEGKILLILPMNNSKPQPGVEISYVAAKPPSNDDRGTLKLLGIFHCIIGAIEMGGAICLLVGGPSGPQFRYLAVGMLLASAVFAYSGVNMMRQRYRWLSLTVASITCLLFPVGTIIGGWTIAVLYRPGVSQLYQSRLKVLPNNLKLVKQGVGRQGDELPPPSAFN